MKLAAMNGDQILGYVFGVPEGDEVAMNHAIIRYVILGVLTGSWNVFNPPFGSICSPGSRVSDMRVKRG